MTAFQIVLLFCCSGYFSPLPLPIQCCYACECTCKLNSHHSAPTLRGGRGGLHENYLKTLKSFSNDMKSCQKLKKSLQVLYKIVVTVNLCLTVFLVVPLQSHRPVYSFEDNGDYIYDVQWSPIHPALFATVDGMGKLDLWNLNTDTEVFPYELLGSLYNHL